MSNATLTKEQNKTITTFSRGLIGYAGTMIGNGCNFAFQSLSLEDVTSDQKSQINDFMLNETFKKILRYKKLPPQAIENMKKKGIEPKKQPVEIILFIVIATNDDLIVNTFIPSEYNSMSSHFVPHDFDAVHEFDYGKLYQYTVECEIPFKHVDEVRREIYEQLHEQGFIQDEESDDEDMLPNLNDIELE